MHIAMLDEVSIALLYYAASHMTGDLAYVVDYLDSRPLFSGTEIQMFRLNMHGAAVMCLVLCERVAHWMLYMRGVWKKRMRSG